MLLGIALLTCWSVVQRWLTAQPVPGDFELVSIGSGVAVLGFLAWGTVRRANILVDSLHRLAAAPGDGGGRRVLDAGVGGGRPRCSRSGCSRARGKRSAAAPRPWCSACRPGGRWAWARSAFAATALAALASVPRLLRGEDEG